MKLSVLMPVYNESRTLRAIVSKVLDAPVDLDLELVCVDDCSSDDSLQILDDLAKGDTRITVISHPANMGKGRAIRTAIEHMTGHIAIIQDADLEYDPAEYPKVIRPIVDGKADAVYGSRFAASEQRRVLFFWHALGNRLLTLLSNMANDLNLTDMETCYKAFRTDVLKRLRLTSDRFGLEPEVTARLAQWGARIYEVPISYHGRTYAEGKNIGWRDGVEALWLIFKFRFLDTRATNEDALATRQSLGRSPRFRRWLLDAFDEYVGEEVLEINAGPGNTTSHLLDRRRLVSSDPDPSHVESLHRRFGHLENFEVLKADLNHPSPELSLFDTAILFDGLQRVDKPERLLANVAQLVRPGGVVLIQLPAGMALFGETDIAIGHVRRFEESHVREIISQAGLEIVWVRSFNRLGGIGWRIHNSLGFGNITSAEARLFDFLVPFAKKLDEVSPGHGLSWLAVARVPSS